MNDILHANIFFFITSVAVVAVTLMALVVLWYVIAILHEVRKVAKRFGAASQTIEEDIAYVRSEVKSHVGKISGFLGSALGSFFSSAVSKPKKRSSPRKRSTSETKPEESV